MLQTDPIPSISMAQHVRYIEKLQRRWLLHPRGILSYLEHYLEQ